MITGLLCLFFFLLGCTLTTTFLGSRTFYEVTMQVGVPKTLRQMAHEIEKRDYEYEE